MRSALGCRAIETAITTLLFESEDCLWHGAPAYPKVGGTPASEWEKMPALHRSTARKGCAGWNPGGVLLRRDLEDDAVAIRSATRCRAVEITGGVEYDAAVWTCSVSAAGKVVEIGKYPAAL
jgi:hypothetical protein